MEAAERMSDKDFTKHMERHHPDGTLLRWNGHRIYARSTWEIYHDRLHRTTECDHDHEEIPMGDRGWVQQTPCVCLNPPTHQTDCTGRQGVLILSDRHGPSIHEKLWEEMDRLMEGLMTDSDAEDGGDRFRAQELAYCLAVFENPYAPSVPEIKKKAMSRWKEQQAVKAHEPVEEA